MNQCSAGESELETSGRTLGLGGKREEEKEEEDPGLPNTGSQNPA